jgi:hypothetical protein
LATSGVTASLVRAGLKYGRAWSASGVNCPAN